MTIAPTVPPRSRFSRVDWLIPLGLALFAFVPVVAGSVRLTELATGLELMGDDNARFVTDPMPVVIHIVAASLYAIGGGFQFAPGLRRAYPLWHRRAGRAIAGLGAAAALSGIWMVFVYPHMPFDGPALAPARLVFGVLTLAFLALGVRAILMRDVPAHRAMMIRAYAVFLGAGTQVFTSIPYMIVAGDPGPEVRDVLMIAGWLINIAVAEWIIRRPLRRRAVA